jgi:hypothetical protein
MTRHGSAAGTAEQRVLLSGGYALAARTADSQLTLCDQSRIERLFGGPGAFFVLRQPLDAGLPKQDSELRLDGVDRQMDLFGALAVSDRHDGPTRGPLIADPLEHRVRSRDLRVVGSGTSAVSACPSVSCHVSALGLRSWAPHPGTAS